MTAGAVTPPRNFDSTFEKYRGTIPLEYIRALAIVSGGGEFKPNNSTKDSAGMFMVSVDMLDAYGKAMGANFSPTELADVQLNTKVAVWLLNNVKKYYSLNYPKTLGENWKNSQYVALVTLGYKVGYSEKGGLGDALKIMEAQYPAKMGIDDVAAVAKARGLKEVLYSPKWISFAKDVTNLYAGSPREQSANVPSVDVPKGKGVSAGLIVALAAIPILAITLGGRK